MSEKALKRWLLVDYAGYPYAPNSLMPDNGLANLAGALLKGGKQVEILDYGTVSMLRRMSSPDLSPHLDRAWNRMRGSQRGAFAALKQFRMLLNLQRYERIRQQLQEQVVAAIAGEVLERIKAHGVDAVGFKLWNGDGFEGSARIARHIRKHAPRIKLFAGGPQVDFFMERILRRHPCFDALVFGEGEETIRLLAETGGNQLSYGSIPNLLYVQNGDIRKSEEKMVANLDDLPMPVYEPDVYPAMRGDEKIKIIVIDESRGCQNDCAFCVHPMKSHHRVRLKSIPRLISEISMLGQRHGFHTFRFAGSCTPYALLGRFAEEVVRQDLHVTYTSFAHIRGSRAADFPLLRKSGCVALFYGVESGSQRILDGMHKRIRVEEIPETIGRTKAAGIFAVGSLIFPAPGEDEHTERETLAMLAKEKLDSVTLQAPIVAPRTDWFETPGKYGIFFKDKGRYLDVAMCAKAKLVLPPSFWDPMPVWIDGKPFRQILNRSAHFGRRLTQLGIPLAIPDETYLMSVKARMDVVAFRDRVLRAFFAGNAVDIAQVAGTINQEV